ncbi:hypothetical protein TNCT_431871 [Trichonephila clavata]|uniref:Uncharacterized protein n=1 Tax=Trichonephila clavata TaxID=2740835 RepID=A0A8X6IL44_TRICU|nr:hypothetical protein TNCT_431871 [Trichonephila clavata]
MPLKVVEREKEVDISSATDGYPCKDHEFSTNVAIFFSDIVRGRSSSWDFKNPQSFVYVAHTETDLSLKNTLIHCCDVQWM